MTVVPETVTNLALLPGFLDPVNLLNSFGTWVLIGLLLVVFIESGLLFPLLPGDSLLFTAGLIAASKSEEIPPFAPLWVLMVTIPIAAILGDQVGYWIGAKGGTRLFKTTTRRSSTRATSTSPRTSSSGTVRSRSSSPGSCPSCAPSRRWSRARPA